MVWGDTRATCHVCLKPSLPQEHPRNIQRLTAPVSHVQLGILDAYSSGLGRWVP